MRAWVVGRDKHFTQYILRIPAKAAVSTVCITHVFGMRAWVVGPDKHFTQYIVRIPAEHPINVIRKW